MNQDIEILRILAKYDKQIEKLYNKLLYQLSKVSLNITKIREGASFSFDDYPEIKEKVNEVLNSYTKEQQDIILSGIDAAMIKSFKANEAKFGEFSRYSNQGIIDMRNTAKNAFIESRMKPEQGLSLSQKVWNYSRQAKAEFEAGMSEILEEGLLSGMSAEELGRKLRNKLKHPDMVYKRYHLKKMTTQGKKDVVEWRRKVVDSEGKVRYIKEDLEKVGRGVYRSSRKNALRLAATEINMAYRYADYVRWNSEPFVIGFRIQLSENHTINGVPFHDMCDDLVGVYPKTFRWAGWHPKCRCIATSILVSKEEMEKISDLPDDEYRNYRSPNLVKKMPKVYNEYVTKEKDRILASMDRGTTPYWVRDNYKQGDIRKKFVWERIGKTKFKTQAQKDAIQKAWDERRRKNAIEAARIKRHASRDAVAIQEAWNSRKEKYAKLMKTAMNVNMAAYGEAWVDRTNLKWLINRKKYHLLEAEYRKVAKQTALARKQKKQLSTLIPDVDDWSQQFSYDELKVVFDNVERTLKRWKWDFTNRTSLETLKDAMEHEITWMSTNGTKYSTWKVARDAYKRKLDLVKHRSDMLTIKENIKDEILLLNSSKSAVGKNLVSEFENLFADDNTDITALSAKSLDIKKKAKQIEADRRWAQKTSGKPVTTASSFTPKSKDETIDDFFNYLESLGINSIRKNDIVYDKGFIHLTRNQHIALYDALKPETDAEHFQLWNHVLKTQRTWRAGYVRTSNSFLINGDFRETKVIGSIDSKAVSALKKHGATDDDIATIKLLDKKISEFSMPVPLRVTRYVEKPALEHIFGDKIIAHSADDIVKEINSKPRVIRRDPAYMSASLNEKENVFTHYPVKLEIEVPPNTPFYMTNNYDESEVVFGRSTPLKLLSATLQKQGWDEYIVLRCRIE